MVTIEPFPWIDVVNDYAINRKTGAFKSGNWRGDGSRLLGLRSPVNARQLALLLVGRTPDGKSEIIRDADKPLRNLGWRITMTAPQTAESLWALAPRKSSDSILKAHILSVERGIDALQKIVADTARRHNNVDVKGLIVACFHPDRTQQTDPNLKTEMLVASVTPIAKDRAVSFSLGPAESREFLARALNSGYEQDLTNGIRERLGLLSTQKANEAQIFGVPRSLKFDKSWSEARQAELIEALNRGKRFSHGDHWLRQAEAKGWGLREVEALLKCGSQRNFNLSSARSEIRNKLREHEQTDAQAQQSGAGSNSKTGTKTTSHSQSH